MGFFDFLTFRAAALKGAGLTDLVQKSRQEVMTEFGDTIVEIDTRDATLLVFADLLRRIEKLEKLNSASP